MLLVGVAPAHRHVSGLRAQDVQESRLHLLFADAVARREVFQLVQVCLVHDCSPRLFQRDALLDGSQNQARKRPGIRPDVQTGCCETK